MLEKHLDIPFYPNTMGDGNQCGQVSLQSVLKYFLKKEFSAQYLDELTNRKKDCWTCTAQLSEAMDILGLRVKYYSKESLDEFVLKGDLYFREHYGTVYDKIIKFIDVDSWVKSSKYILSKDLFERRLISFDEIKKNLSEGNVVMMLIDWDKVSKEPKGIYLGHWVILTGFDEQNFYIHQSGPKDPTPNLMIPKETLSTAYNALGTDNDLIVVFGKK